MKLPLSSLLLSVFFFFPLAAFPLHFFPSFGFFWLNRAFLLLLLLFSFFSSLLLSSPLLFLSLCASPLQLFFPAQSRAFSSPMPFSRPSLNGPVANGRPKVRISIASCARGGEHLSRESSIIRQFRSSSIDFLFGFRSDLFLRTRTLSRPVLSNPSPSSGTGGSVPIGCHEGSMRGRRRNTASETARLCQPPPCAPAERCKQAPPAGPTSRFRCECKHRRGPPSLARALRAPPWTALSRTCTGERRKLAARGRKAPAAAIGRFVFLRLTRTWTPTAPPSPRCLLFIFYSLLSLHRNPPSPLPRPQSAATTRRWTPRRKEQGNRRAP